MKKVVAIRHVPFEDLGTLQGVLVEDGYEIEYVDAPLGGLADIDPLDCQLMVVLGGPIGAYEDDSYPFLRDELKLLEARLAADRPVLGICLGSQLMARALGARVYPGGQKEIGWSPVILSDAGKNSWLAQLGDGTSVLHWHGDTFDLPHGAIRLASTPLYANQAFLWGASALALQFHLEVDSHTLEAWLVGHAAEIASVPGLSVAALREATREHAVRMAKASADILRDWLGTVRYAPAIRYSS